MPSDYLCLIHGLVLASEVELPLPRLAPRQADITYRVSLGTALPASSHSRSDHPDEPWAIEHWIGERLAVEFPDWATFELSRKDVVLVADDTGDPDLVAHLLLDHVVPRIVSLRGDLMLHAAGAVGPSGRAHLFLGRTGEGKSTIVTCLAASGWQLLDDDGIRVINVDGEFHALPGAPGVRLLPDSAAALVPELPPGRPISDGDEKRRFGVEGQELRLAPGPARVGGLYVLNPLGSAGPSVERLGFASALSALTEHGFHFADEPDSIVRQAFERASALAAAAPVWQLVYPNGLDQLYRTRSLIEDIDTRV